MLAYIFPGQGSQKRGMGDRLFGEVPEFVSAEAQIGRLLGYSPRLLCMEDTEGRLNDTRYTQPCLYLVNALHYYSARRSGERPAFLAGHSLGEYNALLAAGVFDLITGLRLVQKRGEIMARVRHGGMAAVIGMDSAAVAAVIRDQELSSIDIANVNSPAQTVVSGPADDIKRAAPVFEKAGARMFVPLQVSAAFHSRYMKDAAIEFAEFLRPFSFSPPAVPVVSNVTGRPYPADENGAVTKSLLARQITSTVRWIDSIQYLASQGTKTFKEIGPGTVLANLLSQLRPVGR